jgi:uncharacterized membrane protein
MKKEMIEAAKETAQIVNDMKKGIAYGLFMGVFPVVVVFVVTFGVATPINWVIGDFAINFTLPTGGAGTMPSFVIGGTIGVIVGGFAGVLAFIWECRLLDKIDFKKTVRGGCLSENSKKQ